MFVLLISALWLLFAPAHAQWTPLERRHSTGFRFEFADPFAASIWRTANSPWYMKSDFPEYRKKTLTIRGLPADQTRYVRTGTFLHRSAEGVLLPRPLMVFFPGVFSDAVSPTSLMHGHFFYNSGYHVLLLSNPWSKNWIVDWAASPMGNMDFEVQAALRIISQFIQENRSSILSVSYFGYSYGGFLAAAAAGSGTEEIQELYLVGAPRDAAQSMQRLDDLADQYYSLIEKKNHLLWPALSYMGKSNQSEIPAKELRLVPAIAVFGGFVEPLAESIITYGYRHQLNFEPPGLTYDQRRHWKRSFRFSNWVREQLPQFPQLMSEGKGRLDYWLERAQKQTDSLRILTSNDDFINRSAAWEDLANDPRLLVLPNGGHVGYMQTEWYWDLLDLHSAPEQKRPPFPVIK